MPALIYAQDPGGSSLLAAIAAALVPRLPERPLIVAHPLAAPIFARAEVAATPLEEAGIGPLPAAAAAVDQWLAALSPSRIICTTSSRYVDLTNARLIASARRAGIPTLAFLDHWVGFDRFVDDDGASVYLPDTVGVPDRYCQERVMAVGAAEARVPIVGHAYLESMMRAVTPGREAGPARVLLVSQPVVSDGSFRGALFLDDRGERAIDRIAAALSGGVSSGAIVLAYRPHPKERRDDPLPSGVLTDTGPGGVALLQRHDIFVGVTSMLLFEASVARRHVVQLDLPVLRQAVAGDWPPYDAGIRLPSIDGLNSTIVAAVKELSAGRRPAGVPGLLLEGSLQRSVALCESFLS